MNDDQRSTPSHAQPHAQPPRRRRAVYSPAPSTPLSPSTAEQQHPDVATTPAPRHPRLRLALRSPRVLWWAWALLALTVALLAVQQQRDRPRALTQKDIDAAVLHTLQTQSLPAMTRRAADAIAPSVVRVVGMGAEGDRRPQGGVGSGVVMTEDGLILTNLHVVEGAKRLRVTFHNGLESPARVVKVVPEQDLAVIRAQNLPDDLQAATMRSTGDLAPGDTVVAVGFPFGIGPSVSAGVVSGLDREFSSPDGGGVLRKLIQFDAAANPGNSGGPLVTAEGEVVGIVTAIFNPTEARTFLGIGFAVPIESAAGAAGMPPF